MVKYLCALDIECCIYFWAIIHQLFIVSFNMALGKDIWIAVICAWIGTHGIFNLYTLFLLFYVIKYTHFHIYVSCIYLNCFLCLLPRNSLLPVGNWGKHGKFDAGPPWRAVWSCQMSGTGWHRRFFMNSSAIVLTQVSSSFSGVADVQRVLKTAKWSIKGLQCWLSP